MSRILRDNNLSAISKLIAEQVNQVTCVDCCKYYVVPTTAPCGHTKCHFCWIKMQMCSSCGVKMDRKLLKLNLPLQIFTEHVHNLEDAFKDFFDISTDNFQIYVEDSLASDADLKKNVYEWLTSSQNRFTATYSQESIKNNTSKKVLVEDVQVHTESVRPPTFLKTDQFDWDNIEVLTDTEENINTNKENVVGPMDIEPYNDIVDVFNDNEYSMENPRRSLRKREYELNIDTRESKNSLDKSKKSNKNWTNVKAMKKEFSKLNKKEINKLNISTEMSKTNDNNMPITTEAINVIDNSKEISLKSKCEELIENNQCDQKDHNNLKNNASLNNKKNPINKSDKGKICFFKKTAFACPMNDKEKLESRTIDTDNVEITIKIGNTITNICIARKGKDSDIKTNSKSNQECSNVHTLITKNDLNNIVSVSISPVQDKKLVDKSIQVTLEENNLQPVTNQSQHLLLSKKNTATANTSSVSAQTKHSLEREFVTIRENILLQNTNKTNLIERSLTKTCGNDYLNDLDVFDSESVKEGNVELLKQCGQIPSAIIKPTNVSKLKSQRNNLKRDGGTSDVDVQCNKKTKIHAETETGQTQTSQDISEIGNYDEILSQVFANIDADMKDVNKNAANKNTQKVNTPKKTPTILSPKYVASQIITDKLDPIHNNSVIQKCSENIFSLNDEVLLGKRNKNPKPNIDIDLTQMKFQETLSGNHKTQCTENEMNIVELSTPQDDDDCESVVEETPQKDTSHLNSKQINAVKIYARKETVLKSNKLGEKYESDSSIKMSTDDSTKINIKETLKEQCIETPMSTFVKEIQYKSTPLARKSLNFNNNKTDNDDPDQTVYSSTFVAAKNTQEMEIMRNAFEQTQNLITKSIRNDKKYCVAASCLSSSEQADVKRLCTQKNWNFVNKFTKEITHLIVNVTEDKKAQRSVKFISALAASIWIVSFEWVEKCLKMNQIVDEEAYEVLDMTGEPGPRRSRLSKQKLFTGIKFFCQPPFGVLDIDTLKEILASAGGVVVDEPTEVKATDTPALLLAAPYTQEDQFIYLAMKLGVVPVHYEWVLNSLGSYTLSSILELLLCPSSLLPPVIAKWPAALLACDENNDFERKFINN